MIFDLLRNRETSRFFVAALLRMTLRQISMATGGKGYPNFRRSARRSRRVSPRARHAVPLLCVSCGYVFFPPCSSWPSWWRLVLIGCGAAALDSLRL